MRVIATPGLKGVGSADQQDPRERGQGGMQPPVEGGAGDVEARGGRLRRLLPLQEGDADHLLVQPRQRRRRWLAGEQVLQAAAERGTRGVQAPRQRARSQSARLAITARALRTWATSAGSAAGARRARGGLGCRAAAGCSTTSRKAPTQAPKSRPRRSSSPT